jgi:hypothetical protein
LGKKWTRTEGHIAAVADLVKNGLELKETLLLLLIGSKMDWN